MVGRQEGHPACKKWGDGGRWALVSPDGVAPSWLVGVSVNLPLHHKVQNFSSPRWSRKKGRKMVVVSTPLLTELQQYYKAAFLTVTVLSLIGSEVLL